jgi:hypothetical protein
VAGWAALLSLIAQHRIFVTHDSLISYAHVWWIDSRLWHGGGIPWHMPMLGHGEALTFPYGVVPWLIGALLWPLFGQWAVTLVLVLGAAGLIAAMFWAFPELRRPWWAVTALANPILVVAPLSGEIPFLWGSALLLTGIGCWRRGHRAWAIVLVGIGQLTHPAVVLPIAALVVALRLRWEPDRRRLLGAWALSVCIAAPGIWPVLASPVFSDSSTATKLVEFVGTVLIRACVLLPALLVLVADNRPHWLAPSLAAAALVLNVVVLAPLQAGYSWGALTRQPDTTIQAFTATAQFRPGATYRLVRGADGKVGMYQLMRAGGKLDSEFFPESIWFGNFPSVAAYSQFLVDRKVDHVLIFYDGQERHPTNELALLRRLANAGGGCTTSQVGVRLVRAYPGWDDYAIDRSCRTPADRSER